VAGGIAASIYRDRPRLTNDIGIAIDLGQASEDKAIQILNKLGFNAAAGWISDSNQLLKRSVALVIGRKNLNELESTIDFLLPVFPWLPQAVQRANENRIDYGFAKFPTLTPEDIIIAKAFALKLDENRFQDMDDIQSILKQHNSLDLIYLARAFEELRLSLPKTLEAIAPSALKRASKNSKKK
jgi:hypothetical protein